MDRRGRRRDRAKGRGSGKPKPRSEFNDPAFDEAAFDDPAFGMGHDNFDSILNDRPFPWMPAIEEFEDYIANHAFITGEKVPTAEDALKAAADARFSISRKAVAATGIEPVDEVLAASLAAGNKNGAEQEERIEGDEYPKRKEKDFFARISSSPELVIELVKYIDPKTLLSLYCLHKDVNGIINGHLTHTMRLCSNQHAPEAARIYPFTLYGSLCRLDPVGRPHPNVPGAVRMVPSIRWLQMIVHRETTVHDILASMARKGHRMPPEMNLTLKKMWLLMDIATSAQRAQVIHSKYFSAMDIFRMQMFFVKLDLRFNDPIDGPGEDHLRKLMLGQRGLTPLSKMLKRTGFTEVEQVLRACVRYDWQVEAEHRHYPILGIPPEEIGVGHLEGWGKGRVHLLRPDQLVVREAVRRKLDLKNHIMGMILWGYVDPITGKDTPATDEEMYMSDDGSQDKPKHPMLQDYEWLEMEPKIYGEKEALQDKRAERDRQMKDEEMREADEARAVEEAKRFADAKMAEEAAGAGAGAGAGADKEDDLERLEKEWRKDMTKEEEREWKEKMRNMGTRAS